MTSIQEEKQEAGSIETQGAASLSIFEKVVLSSEEIDSSGKSSTCYYFLKPLTGEQALRILAAIVRNTPRTKQNKYYIDTRFSDFTKSTVRQHAPSIVEINGSQINSQNLRLQPLIYVSDEQELYGLGGFVPSCLDVYLKDYITIPVVTLDDDGDVTVITSASLKAAWILFNTGVDAETIVSFSSLPGNACLGEGSVRGLRRDIPAKLIEIPTEVNFKTLKRAIEKFPDHSFILHPDMEATPAQQCKKILSEHKAILHEAKGISVEFDKNPFGAWKTILKTKLRSLAGSTLNSKKTTIPLEHHSVSNLILLSPEKILVTVAGNGSLTVKSHVSSKIAAILFAEGMNSSKYLLSFTNLSEELFGEGSVLCMRRDISAQLLELSSEGITVEDIFEDFPDDGIVLSSAMSLSVATKCAEELSRRNKVIFLKKFSSWTREDYVAFAQDLLFGSEYVFLPTMDVESAAIILVNAPQSCQFSFHEKCSQEMIAAVRQLRLQMEKQFPKFEIISSDVASDKRVSQCVKIYGNIPEDLLKQTKAKFPKHSFLFSGDMTVKRAKINASILKEKCIHIGNFARWTWKHYGDFAKSLAERSTVALQSNINPIAARHFVAGIRTKCTVALGNCESWREEDYIEFADFFPSYAFLVLAPGTNPELVAKMKLSAANEKSIKVFGEPDMPAEAEQNMSSSQMMDDPSEEPISEHENLAGAVQRKRKAESKVGEEADGTKKKSHSAFTTSASASSKNLPGLLRYGFTKTKIKPATEVPAGSSGTWSPVPTQSRSWSSPENN